MSSPAAGFQSSLWFWRPLMRRLLVKSRYKFQKAVGKCMLYCAVLSSCTTLEEDCVLPLPYCCVLLYCFSEEFAPYGPHPGQEMTFSKKVLYSVWDLLSIAIDNRPFTGYGIFFDDVIYCPGCGTVRRHFASYVRPCLVEMRKMIISLGQGG